MKKKTLKNINKIIKSNPKYNINRFLRKNSSLSEANIIKISYDLQAGSYVKSFDRDYLDLVKMLKPVIEILKKTKFNSILDFGTGELTSFYSILKNINIKNKKILACDLSKKRLSAGINKFKFFFKNKKVKFFVNNPYKLPFKRNSIDIITTCHALEPNKEKVKLILEELLRICSKKIILVEPDYNISSIKAKRRMKYHNYVTNLEKVIKNLKFNYKKIKIQHQLNKLNPSSVFVINVTNAKKN